MFAVLTRFSPAPAHRASFLGALDDSLAITREQHGFLAYQVLASEQDDGLRVCLMLWESSGAFQAFLKTEACQKAHADVQPEFFSSPPVLEQFDVLSTWHAPTAAV